MLINGQLKSAQPEFFTNGTKPAASTMYYRMIWLTDLQVMQVSDGTNWITLGSDEQEHSWELNGNYPGLTFPLLNIDAIFFAPFDLTITQVWIYNGTAGGGGTTEYDLKVASPGGAFSSIFSTTGKITSAAASDIWTDSGSIVGAQGGVTKPVLSTTSITAGQGIKFDLITSMTTTATDARIRLIYRRT